MSRYVLGFREIDQTQVALAGGKGANLGELSRIEGLRVPAGFCITTEAFQRIMAEAPSVDETLMGIRTISTDLYFTQRGIERIARVPTSPNAC